jgi:excisionase family DNA binding protein
MNELLTVKEAADRLGTAERFIRRLIFERRIPYTKLGRHVRIAAATWTPSSGLVGSRPGRLRCRRAVVPSDGTHREADA